MSSTSVDDRTTKARIRDAAISCVAEKGLAAMTARSIAEAADVSPGLVIHHFGSMDALRTACDEHIAATIREYKRDTISEGPGIDVLAALREAEFGPLAGYLAAVLADDSPAVAKLVDDLVDDAEVYMQQSVETGMSRPTDDPRGRAAVMLMWSLGAMVMHKHVKRILGVDPTDPNFGADPVAAAAYVGPAYEILGQGIFTEEFATNVRESLAEASAEKPARK